MLLDILPHTPQWHDIRRENVGGSEIAALFSCQAGYQQTVFSLYHLKRGDIEEHAAVDDLAKLGLYLESGIAAFVREKRGWKTRPGRYAVDDVQKGMGASLDFEIEFATEGDMQEMHAPLSGPGCLQIKKVRHLTWRDHWVEDEPPVHILLQHQHEMACSGYLWGAVAAEIDGRVIIKLYTPRPKIADAIRERVATFWSDVDAGREPQADASEKTYQALREMQRVERVTLDLTEGDDAEEAEQMAELLFNNRAAEAAARNASGGARNRIMQIVNGADEALTIGYRIRVSKNGAITIKPRIGQE